MPATVYILDACTLYPVATRDLLLTLAAQDAFTPRWTQHILDEMRRNILDDYPDIDPNAFDTKLIGSMATTFPDAMVTGYEHMIDQMDNHPKDRHVAPAAIRAEADGILTDNVKDFKSKKLRDANISVYTPAAFVTRLIKTSPSMVFESIINMAQRKRNPPVSPAQVIDALARNTGFSQIENQLRDLFASS